MNFGEEKHEPGSLEESLAEANLPTDPRRLIDRGYKFTITGGINKSIYIGTIIGLRFERPHEIGLVVSDTSVFGLYSHKDGSHFCWTITTTDGQAWIGELTLL